MEEESACAHMAPSRCSAGEEAGGASAHVDNARHAAPERRGVDSSHLPSNPSIRGVASRPHRSQRHTALAAVAAGTILAMTLAVTVLVVREGTGEAAGFGKDEYLFDASSSSDGRSFGAVDGLAWKGGGSRRLTMLSQPLIVAGIGDGLFALVVLYVALFVTCGIACLVENARCTCISILLFIAILIITLILVLSPRVPAEEKAARLDADKLKVFDMFFIPQVFIMTLVWLGVLVSLVMFFFNHCISPVYIRGLDD